MTNTNLPISSSCPLHKELLRLLRKPKFQPLSILHHPIEIIRVAAHEGRVILNIRYIQTVVLASARCSPNDHYDFSIGFSIALSRALEQLASQLRSTHLPPPTKASSWIPWFGGEMPVPFGSEILVNYRNGTRCATTAGSPYARNWGIDPQQFTSYDIIAYKLVPTPEPSS